MVLIDKLQKYKLKELDGIQSAIKISHHSCRNIKNIDDIINERGIFAKL